MGINGPHKTRDGLAHRDKTAKLQLIVLEKIASNIEDLTSSNSSFNFRYRNRRKLPLCNSYTTIKLLQQSVSNQKDY